MELKKIEAKDYADKGVQIQEDVPQLSARDMKYAVEQIVIEVAIEKINEIIDYLFEKGASKEDLQKLLIDAGSVSSVFGRAGDVKPQKGDYTPEMVGAAKEIHAERHKANGSDPISAENIGAADIIHAHGDITSDGKIGESNGMVLMTGLLGKIEAKAKEETGFMLVPAVKSIDGAFAAEDNVDYIGEGITDFVFDCDEEKKAFCHGFITFASPGTISLGGFDYIDDPDDIYSAEEGSRWEFDLLKGCLIIRKRSE